MNLHRSLKDIIVNDFRNSLRIAHKDGSVEYCGFDKFLELIVQHNLLVFYQENNGSTQLLLSYAGTSKEVM
ncbi:hypothetical protein J4421_05085 [Candidatus Woesearchaeota archaeon]|nr:hypothetical protein [Candidatus Woesearchaeota archaeon]